VERLDNDASCLVAVNSARVSFNKESTSFTTREEKETGSDEGLLSYLAKNNHWTPFSHVRHTFVIPHESLRRNRWFYIDEEALAGVVYTRTGQGYKIRTSLHGWLRLLNEGVFTNLTKNLLTNALIKRNPECMKAYGVVRQDVPERTRPLLYIPQAYEICPRFFDVTLRLKMPIFVTRQWFKHQVGFTRNEVSRRYVDDEPEIHVPPEYRRKPEGSIKQGSGDIHPASLDFKHLNAGTEHSCSFLYNVMISEGVCPEQARGVLPLNTYTEFWETASLHSYKRLIEQRIDPHAQLEIQHYANAVKELLEKDYDQFLN